jgi:hypothetical protein
MGEACDLGRSDSNPLPKAVGSFGNTGSELEIDLLPIHLGRQKLSQRAFAPALGARESPVLALTHSLSEAPEIVERIVVLIAYDVSFDSDTDAGLSGLPAQNRVVGRKCRNGRKTAARQDKRCERGPPIPTTTGSSVRATDRYRPRPGARLS